MYHQAKGVVVKVVKKKLCRPSKKYLPIIQGKLRKAYLKSCGDGLGNRFRKGGGGVSGSGAVKFEIVTPTSLIPLRVGSTLRMSARLSS